MDYIMRWNTNLITSALDWTSLKEINSLPLVAKVIAKMIENKNKQSVIYQFFRSYKMAADEGWADEFVNEKIKTLKIV